MTTIQIHDPELDHRLKQAGASKTIYALVMPETEAVKSACLGTANPDPDQARRLYLEQFREAWTGKQFAAHEEFLRAWIDWASPFAAIDTKAFRWQYPASGASEGLFHTIASYGNKARAAGFSARIHIFAGEYEGYKAYAAASRIEVVEHARAQWRTVAARMAPSDLFCLSQPSAIDGNIWPEANAFIESLETPDAVARVILDVTYIGAVAEPPVEKFHANSSAVAALVFSLSKPFGVYYDRIGGVLAREEMPSLFGNQWFKNLTSLQLGTTLLRRYGVFDLARRYRPVQQTSAQTIGTRLGLVLQPSDVVLLATADASQADPALANFLRRPQTDPSARLRVCLTPEMARLIGTSGPIPTASGRTG